MNKLFLKQLTLISWVTILVFLVACIFWITAPLTQDHPVDFGLAAGSANPIAAGLVQQIVVMGPLLIASSNRHKVHSNTSYIVIVLLILYTASMLALIFFGLVKGQLVQPSNIADEFAENVNAIQAYQSWVSPIGLLPIAILYTAK